MKKCISGGGSGARIALGEPVGLVRQPECNTLVKTPCTALAQRGVQGTRLACCRVVKRGRIKVPSDPQG